MAARTRSISASHPTTQMRLLLPRAVSLRWVSDINVYFLNARSVIPWRPIVKFFTDTLHSAPKKWDALSHAASKLASESTSRRDVFPSLIRTSHFILLQAAVPGSGANALADQTMYSTIRPLGSLPFRFTVYTA